MPDRVLVCNKCQRLVRQCECRPAAIDAIRLMLFPEAYGGEEGTSAKTGSQG